MSHDVQRLIDLVDRLGRPRILVLGDLILDRYTFGDAERVSQEAPVLVLRADRQESRLGGAASVALLLRGLDAQVTLIGVVGADAAAKETRSLLDNAGVRHEHVVADSSRPTTVKERFIGRAQNRHPHQILRVDNEERHALAPGLERELLDRVMQELSQSDVVL
ncbi:MAG TPA: PfkB family carbohydrate kinase, partial [Pirellulales bacterium]